MKIERRGPGGHPDTAALLPLSDIQLTGIMGSREAFAEYSFSYLSPQGSLLPSVTGPSRWLRPLLNQVVTYKRTRSLEAPFRYLNRFDHLLQLKPQWGQEWFSPASLSYHWRQNLFFINHIIRITSYMPIGDAPYRLNLVYLSLPPFRVYYCLKKSKKIWQSL